MAYTDDSAYDPEFLLLGKDPLDIAPTNMTHAFRTAPIVTGDVLHGLGSSMFPQRALYGRILAQRASGFPIQSVSPKIYINTNAPFSALVCGVQGSGKSHSTSVLLEGCLMSDPRLGTLPAPLSAIVFHFDTAAGGGLVQPCEAAYLAALDSELGVDATPPTVTVLVLPTNLKAMQRVYAGLPAVKVEPLHFSTEDISGERLLAMMKVDENAQMPLYMEAIMTILRSMENDFDYDRFRDNLKLQKFNASQKAMLNLRLSLLDSCLQGGNLQNRVSSHFKQGQLMIIDLSSPFMDGSSVCGFFDLILGLFVEADISATGKLIVLDEAHKYLSESQSGTSARLTDSLLTVIRQQRHLATRVVISTQEPTVVPSKYLDLCSFIIAHRFSSPKWLKILAEHVSAADDSFDELFSKIVSLGTGQAIVFAPNGLGMRSTNDSNSWGATRSPSSSSSVLDGAGVIHNQVPAAIGQGYLHVQSRLRITRDGGHSILAVPDEAGTTRLGRVSARSSNNTVQNDGIPRSAIDVSDDEEVPVPIRPVEAQSAAIRANAPIFVPASMPWSSFLPVSSAIAAPPMTSSSAPIGAPLSPYARTYNPYLPSLTSYPAPSTGTHYSLPAAMTAVVKYLELKRMQLGAKKLSFNHIHKQLKTTVPGLSIDQCEEVLRRAEQQGLLVLAPKKRGFWVMLPDGSPQADSSTQAFRTSGPLDFNEETHAPHPAPNTTDAWQLTVSSAQIPPVTLTLP